MYDRGLQSNSSSCRAMIAEACSPQETARRRLPVLHPAGSETLDATPYVRNYLTCNQERSTICAKSLDAAARPKALALATRRSRLTLARLAQLMTSP